ncbi:MAG: ABC transporter substrate-binding protein [Granulosicoccus sp.]
MNQSPTAQPFRWQMMRGWLIALCLSLGLAVGSTAATAADHPAQQMIEKAITEMIELLETQGDELSNDPELLQAKVNEIFVPHLDFNTMTKLAVGKFWRKADSGQKTELVVEFQKLLMNTYTGALKEYSGETISFEPFRPQKRDDRAVVKSVFSQSGGAGDVPVIYKLRDKNGWSIYDIEVNNLSLVTSYRTAFAGEIRKGGIGGLLDTLKERNAKKS